jgi:hypothetical protein
MEISFYDLKGNAISYIDSNGLIYLFNGQSVGYIENDTVYSIAGHHLGWFEEGWIRDLKGRRVFYTNSATGSGPVTPVKHVKPVKGVKHILSKKGIKHVKRIKSTKSSSWSAFSGEMFFYQ